MNKHKQRRLCNRLKRFKKTGDAEIRNEVYHELQPLLFASVKSALGRARIYEPEAEVLGLTWDAFEAGLEQFDGKQDEICTFFVNSTYSYVSEKVRCERRSQKRFRTLDDETANQLLVNGSGHDQYSVTNGLISAKEFWGFLPEEYRMVFEDAVLSLDDVDVYRKRKNPKLKMPSTRYYEAKRVMRLVAKFLIAQP